MRRIRAPLAALCVLLAAAGCAPPETPAALPGLTDLANAPTIQRAALDPSPTLRLPLTFATATAIPAGSYTPPAVDTPTPTPPPAPPIEEVQARYQAEIAPLAARLEAAGPPPEGVDPPSLAAFAVRLVPLDERLYYVQTVLYPERDPLPTDPAGALYVVYGYARGPDLSLFGLGAASTQGVTATVRLVAEVDGALALIEEVEGHGGSGSSSHIEFVWEAVEPLGALGSAAGDVEDVVEDVLISGTEIGVRGFLRGLAPPGRTAYVSWLLDSSYWVEREQAADLLGLSVDGVPVATSEEAVPRLMAILADEDEKIQVRRQAAGSLGRFGPEGEDAVPLLLALLEDEGQPYDVRVSTAFALGEVGPATADAIPALIAALEDQDETGALRSGAIYALGRMGPAAGDAVPHLLAILQDESIPGYQRGRAAEALGLIGAERERVIPALIDALDGESEDLREDAAGALQTLSGEDAADWRAWWDTQD